ncbi:hypothetical protein LCGC14_0337130 [marine sediment metagenome]|uniref:Uncharacterized protein n=1 Tax=marine sediment metagenome TaxID=412755 RepID=A0A0F9W1X1_9ZZZZ
MEVAEFVKTFIERNTLVRLWYKKSKGMVGQHKEVIKGDKPMMSWELEKSKYKKRVVIGVTDILYLKSPYVEAVNLVIKRN